MKLMQRLSERPTAIPEGSPHIRLIAVKIGRQKKVFKVLTTDDWGAMYASKAEVGRRGAVVFGTYVHPSMDITIADGSLKPNLYAWIEARVELVQAVVAQELQPHNEGHFKHLHFVFQFNSAIALPWIIGELSKNVATSTEVQLMMDVVWKGPLGAKGFKGMMAYCIKRE